MAKLSGVSQAGPKALPLPAFLCILLLVSGMILVTGCSGVVQGTSTQPPPPPPPLAVTISSLPQATAQTPYSASLSVTGGTAPYGWSISSGSLPSGLTLSNSGQISGTPTTPGTSSFVVKVADSSSPAQSTTASLSIVVASSGTPTITTQPANQTVTAGQTATFTVVASGTAPLNYQWQKNGANIAGATSSSYTTPATTTADSGSTFDVVVSNSAGTATSNAATLTVNATAAAPTITTQPASQTVTAGQTATFTVVASGTAPLNYQWQKNGANLAGATSASYTTPVTTTADSGSTFLVAVTNVAGTATSNAATLTVNAPGSGPDLTPPACGLNNDSTNHPPAGSAVTTVTPVGGSPASYSWHDFVLQVPDVGGTWVDNTYGCTSQILTNASTKGAGQVHNYAISPAMDRSDCYVLALDANAGLSSQYIIYVGSPSSTPPGRGPAGCPGNPGQVAVDSAHMPARTSHNEFVWDYFSGGKFWFANGNTIRSCVITGINATSCQTAHTFSEYAGAGVNFIDYAAMNSNGWIDAVGQNTAGGTMDIFLYDTVHDAKSPAYTTGCTGSVTVSNQPGCIHKMAGPTLNNGILVQFTGGSCSAESGNHLWESPWLAPMPQIECRTDHVDVLGDLSGNEVGAFEDFLDNPGPWAPCANAYRPTLARLPLSGPPQCVFDVPVEFGWDISARDYPIRAWELWSVQGSQGGIGPSENCNSSTSYADPTTGNWNSLANELVLSRVDVNGDYGKVWRLGLTHERGKCGGNTFYSDPRASLSIDGKYVVYDTNARFGGTGSGPTVLTDIVVMGPLF